MMINLIFGLSFPTFMNYLYRKGEHGAPHIRTCPHPHVHVNGALFPWLQERQNRLPILNFDN